MYCFWFNILNLLTLQSQPTHLYKYVCMYECTWHNDDNHYCHYYNFGDDEYYDDYI